MRASNEPRTNAGAGVFAQVMSKHEITLGRAESPRASSNRPASNTHAPIEGSWARLRAQLGIDAGAPGPETAPDRPQNVSLSRAAPPPDPEPPAASEAAPGPVVPRLKRGGEFKEIKPASEAAPGPVVPPPPREAAPADRAPRHAAGSIGIGPALPLTPEQQVKLAALPEPAHDRVLHGLMSDDPILRKDALQILAPPRPAPQSPQSLPELLSRVREDASFPALAADWLTKALEDFRSYNGFKARCEAAWRGEIAPERLVSALQRALGPKAKNRGAIFMHELKHSPTKGA
jgi:hypothetical protein